jgi:hypothetical protein
MTNRKKNSSHSKGEEKLFSRPHLLPPIPPTLLKGNSLTTTEKKSLNLHKNGLKYEYFHKSYIELFKIHFYKEIID